MRKLLPTLVFILIFFLSAIRYPLSANADFNSAYQDYTYTNQLYRTAVNEYQIAKSSYQTYRTLTAQNEAINKFQKVLKARNQVMTVYYDLVQEKMNSTIGVSSDSKNTFNSIRLSEEAWLSDHQKKIDAAASLEDLNSVSTEFDQRYSQMDTETKQAIGTIELAKVATLGRDVDLLVERLSGRISDINKSGEDTSFASRGLISARNKLQLYSYNFDAARNSFYPQKSYGNESINLFSGQRQLSGAKQYLSETITLLLEIINNITG